MKTTFSRLFAMIVALLLVCMVFTGVSFRFLLLSSIEAEKKQALQADAEAIAVLAEAYESSGELKNNWDFRISLSLFTQVGEAEALICDPEGQVLLCSCDQFTCDHLGKTVDAAFFDDLNDDGSAFQRGVLTGIYEETRFLSGCRIVSRQSGENLGYVVISAPATQISGLIRQSFTLFIYTALAAVFLAVLAATFLSRMQVKPLARMAEAARQFGHGNLEVRVPEEEEDPAEINELARAFNTMAESLEQSEQRRQEFVANVSHELKTPMTTIGGYIDGMLDGTIPQEKQPYYMQIVSDEVRRLSRLVRNMLDIARLQAQGADESRKVRFDFCDAMGEALITFEQKINAKQLQVSVDLPDKSVWVRAERDSITQVLYNLLDNAIKFCPQRGALGLSLRTDGQKAEATVQNTGPTIDPAELPFLFDRFHKADKSRSRDREGWGLGLYIAKTIVGASGGDIWAESRDGVTKFCFTLPTVR